MSGKAYTLTSEIGEQETVVEYCDLRHIPIVHIPIVHIPNEGKRSKAYGAQLKRAGMRRGFPDLFIPVPYGGFCGLLIEMKNGRGKTTPEQEKWLRELNSRGYKATVCVGADAAINEINEYLKRKGT